MKRLATISISALVLLASCGGAAAPAAPAAAAGGSIAVKLTDSAISPVPASVSAGKVTFKITNAGSIEHELVVLKTSLAADKIPANPDKPGKVKEDGNVGEVEGIAVKETKDLTLDLQPGSYVLICDLPAHYSMGMHVAFTVK